MNALRRLLLSFAVVFSVALRAQSVTWDQDGNGPLSPYSVAFTSAVSGNNLVVTLVSEIGGDPGTNLMFQVSAADFGSQNNNSGTNVPGQGVTIPLPANGQYYVRLAVWGSGNPRSPEFGPFTAGAAPPPPPVHRAKVQFQNTEQYPLMFRGVHPVDGQVFQITLNPGETFIGTYTVSTAQPIEISFAVQGYRLADGAIWTKDPTALPTFQQVRNAAGDPVTVTPQTVANADAPLTTQTPPAPANAPGSSPGSNTYNTVYNAPAQASGGTATYTGPTDNTFKEGIAKIEKPLNQLVEADKARTAAEQKATADAATKATEATTMGNTKKAEATALVNNLNSATGTPLAIPSTGPSASGMWTLELLGYSFNFDPAGDSTVVAGVAWFRAFIQWLLFGLYAWWVWGEIQSMIRATVVAQQARGNAVAGGTGAQATAFIAATAFTVILFTMVPAAWALTETPGISVSSFWSTASNVWGATGPVPSRILYLLYFFFPVGFIATLIAHVFLFRKLALGLHSGVFIAIRFLVP